MTSFIFPLFLLRINKCGSSLFYFLVNRYTFIKKNQTIHKQQKFGQKKDTGKWSQQHKRGRYLTHQNKTIQLTLAIRTNGLGSELHDQHRDNRTVKTKTHIKHITSFGQQIFDIAQRLVEAKLRISTELIPHL